MAQKADTQQTLGSPTPTRPPTQRSSTLKSPSMRSATLKVAPAQSSSAPHPTLPHQVCVLEGLHSLLSQGLLCDVTLRAGGTCLPVHRCVLAAGSPYFRAMFTLETKESRQECIDLHDVSGSTLTDLVTFLYTGAVSLTEDNVQPLTTVAHMMQISTLMEECESFMSSALSSENCVEVLNFADFMDMGDLKLKCEQYILQNFPDVCKSEEFLTLPPSSLSSILSSDDLNVSTEEKVFESMLSWVEYDTENRKTNLLLWLLCVRFPLFSLDYMMDVISVHPLITNNIFASHIVQRAIEHKLGDKTDNPDNKTEQIKFNSKLRFGMCNRNMMIFSGGAYDSSSRAFCCYDPDTDKAYHTIKPHPSFDLKGRIDLYKLVVTEAQEIYFIGGIFFDDYHFEANGGRARKTVLRYNPRQTVWEEMPAMTHPHCGFGVSCYHDNIYVFGGFTSYPNHPPIDHVEVYDTKQEVWSGCDPLPIGVAHPATAVVQDWVYVCGGVDTDCVVLDTVLQFSLRHHQWAILDCSMPVPRAEGTAVCHGSMLYVLGGKTTRGNALSVCVLSTDKKKWSYTEDFPDDRKFTSVTKGDDCIYVCGGVRHFTSRFRSLTKFKTSETTDLYKFTFRDHQWAMLSRSVNNGSNFTCVYASVNQNLVKETVNSKSKSEIDNAES